MTFGFGIVGYSEAFGTKRAGSPTSRTQAVPARDG
jgi:hypothetical protein